MKNKYSVAIPEWKPGSSRQSIINLDQGFVFDMDIEIPKGVNFSIRNKNLQNELAREILTYLDIKNVLITDNIVFGFGSYSILERLAWKIIPKGTMIGEFPQFRFFPLEYISAGGTYQGFWNPQFEFPIKEFLQALNRKDVKALYINNPSNPLGKVWPSDEIEAIIKKALQKNILVIVDEIYGDLLPTETSFARLVVQYSNLIILRSFSKIFGLGNLRVGYMIAQKKIIDRYLQLRDWDEINNLGAYIALQVLRDKKYRTRLQKQCRLAKENVTKIMQENAFEIIPGDALVPLLFVKSTKGDFGEYFRKRNIRIEGSKQYTSLKEKFPKSYARFRLSQECLKPSFIQELKKRL